MQSYRRKEFEECTLCFNCVDIREITFHSLGKCTGPTGATTPRLKQLLWMEP